MIPAQNPNWCDWVDDFLADWQLELEAPKEFWSMMQELTPMQVLIVREVFDLNSRRAYEAGQGVPL